MGASASGGAALARGARHRRGDARAGAHGARRLLRAGHPHRRAGRADRGGAGGGRPERRHRRLLHVRPRRHAGSARPLAEELPVRALGRRPADRVLARALRRRHRRRGAGQPDRSGPHARRARRRRRAPAGLGPAAARAAHRATAPPGPAAGRLRREHARERVHAVAHGAARSVEANSPPRLRATAALSPGRRSGRELETASTTRPAPACGRRSTHSSRRIGRAQRWRGASPSADETPPSWSRGPGPCNRISPICGRRPRTATCSRSRTRRPDAERAAGVGRWPPPAAPATAGPEAPVTGPG